jgi:3-hydroxyisobutyrate dehydrogenase-like beta-hydroxyacid dehydrogenase
MARKVGVIGLGDIGRGVAANFEKAGFELTVCDVRAEAMAPFEGRAQISTRPADLASLCEVVVVAVVNDAQLESVVAGPEGVLAGLASGSAPPLILVLSTVGIETVRQMAERATAAGSELVDCGVSGGPVAAAEGKLVAMVGGTDEAVERVRPVVEAFASHVLHMGPPGAGLQAKLARNIVQYGSWLAAFEGQRLAEAAGIELPKLAQAIRESDAMIGGASRLMFRETVEPFEETANAALVDAMRAGANLAHKDLRAALALAGEVGVSLPMTELTEMLCDSVFGLAAIPAVFAGEDQK